jgi:hypothetical protein
VNVSGQFHASAASFPGNHPPVPFLYEACWASEPVWMLGLGNYILPLPGIELQFHGRPARSLVGTPDEMIFKLILVKYKV